MSNHARLSPSAAHRWIRCPGSIQLCESMSQQRKRNEAAEIGTIAHKLAELILTMPLKDDDDDLVGDIEKLPLFMSADGFNDFHEITQEILDGVKIYTDYVMDKRILGETLIEHYVDLLFLNVPGLTGGTADCVILDYETGYLQIVDFKFGRIAVSPENNEQLMCYALGMLNHPLAVNCETVVLTIVQPRSNDGEVIKSWIV